MTKYVLIPENTLKAKEISEEHTLNADEIQKLIIYKDLIRKFIEQRAISIQFDIWEWKWEWNTELWLEVVQQLSKIWQDIWNLEEVFWKYQTELKEKEINKK